MGKKIVSQFSKDLFFYGIGQAFNLLTPLLVVPHIIKTCGLENFGKSSTALAFAFFVIVIVDFGVDIIGVKDVSTNRDNKMMLRKILATTFLSRLIVLLLLITFLTLAFLFIPFFAVEKKLFFLTLFILLGQYLNPTWFLQGIENFRQITVLNIISKTLYLVLIYIFIKEPKDYVYINLFLALGMIIPFSIGLYYCLKEHQLKKEDCNINEIKLYLKEGYHFCISQLFLSFKNYSPILLISYLGGFNIAGLYKIIEQIITLFRTYLQVIFRFFYPKICFFINGNRKEGIRFWKKINMVNMCFVTFLLILVFVFSQKILFFFKVNQSDMESMVDLLRMSLSIPLLIAISYSLEQLLFSLDKKNFYIRVIIVSVIINFFMMYLLFNSYKLKGLIASLLITEISLILAYSIYLFLFFKREKIINK